MDKSTRRSRRSQRSQRVCVSTIMSPCSHETFKSCEHKQKGSKRFQTHLAKTCLRLGLKSVWNRFEDINRHENALKTGSDLTTTADIKQRYSRISTAEMLRSTCPSCYIVLVYVTQLLTRRCSRRFRCSRSAIVHQCSHKES